MNLTLTCVVEYNMGFFSPTYFLLTSFLTCLNNSLSIRSITRLSIQSTFVSSLASILKISILEVYFRSHSCAYAFHIIYTPSYRLNEEREVAE